LVGAVVVLVVVPVSVSEELSSWPASSSLDPDARTDLTQRRMQEESNQQERGIFPSRSLAPGAWLRNGDRRRPNRG
jgi:hypothetical protein